MSSNITNLFEFTKPFLDKELRLFPTKDGHMPKEWPVKATNNKLKLAEWFKEFDANGYGVNPGNKAIIIDVDVKDGKEGKTSLAYLVNTYGLTLDTFTVRSKSGGVHLYYQYPKHIPDNKYVLSTAPMKLVNKLIHGVDVRGNKGQCVGPTADNNYKLIKDLPLAELPKELAIEIPTGDTQSVAIDITSAEALIYDDPSLKGVIPDSIDHPRHQTLLSLTASWARKVPLDTARVLLKEAIGRVTKYKGDTDDFSYEAYFPRLEDAYKKFSPVTNDKLQYLVDHLVYVTHGDKVFRLDKPRNIASIKMPNARSEYANWTYWAENANGNPVERKAFAEWLKHPDRRYVHNTGYKPVKSLYYNCPIQGCEVINTFRAPNNVLEGTTVTDKSVQPFLDLMSFLWAEHADHMIDWCAHLLQNPTKKVLWAPILITPVEGMGKNLMFTIVSKLLGEWNTSQIQASLFKKSFNTFLVQNQLTLVNEVQDLNKQERRQMLGQMKTYITDSVQSIEGKGADVYQTEIYTNFLFFSNEADSIEVEKKSRRFFVHINKNPRQEDKFYIDIVKWMGSEIGANNLRQWLFNRDITKFGWDRHAIETKSKVEVTESNKSAELQTLEEHIQVGYSIFASDIITKDSWNFYLKYMFPNGRRISAAHARFLFKEVTQSVKMDYAGELKSRQLRLQSIVGADDPDLLYKSNSIKTTAFTIRNHGGYDTAKTEKIKNEYDKALLAAKQPIKKLVDTDVLTLKEA